MRGMFDKQEVLAVIEDVISPYIGRSMARASTKVHCEKLGLAGAKLTAEEVGALLDQLSKAMLVFVGGEKTDRIRNQINQKIGLGG